MPPPRSPDDLEPLPAILPPEGITVARLRPLAARVAKQTRGRTDVAGVRGCAAAIVASTIARDADVQVVVVTSDLEAARRMAEDVSFFIRGTNPREDAEETGQGDVLVFAAHESSPYANVHPDRRAAMSRMATLFHVAEGLPWRVLVVSAAALVRRVAPRKAVRSHAQRIVAESDLDRDALITTLSEGGYSRVPIVEDPGSFAVRGALIDVWSPASECPVRVELDGDLIVSLKEFDPFEQRIRKVDGVDVALNDLWLTPAREALLSTATVAHAKESIDALTDAIDLPTTRARALADDVANGRSFFGAEGFLPAYYDALESLFDYLGREVVFVLEDPPAITCGVRAELKRAIRDASGKGSEPHYPTEAFYVDERDVLAELESRRVVCLHRTAVMGVDPEGIAAYEVAVDPADISARNHDDLDRAVKVARAAKGNNATLGALVRRVRHWHEHGLSVFLTARTQTQAERMASLLTHQKVACDIRLGAFDPAWLTESHSSDRLLVVVGPLSRGTMLPGEGWVFVTEEEIFGARTHRRPEKKSGGASRAFLEDLRSLKVGDFVVHAEHGIGKYHGLVHKDVGGLVVDLLVVEYAKGDKLYLPVYRLNQIQKYAGGDHGTPTIDRLGGSTFAKSKARAKKAVRQMADELLRLEAERHAQPGHALAPRDDDYRAFEATFPFDETSDQTRAIDDVNRDLEMPRPMDRLVCGDVGFGKTEVAIRAAFRMAMAGRQVALLCPTTVLAQQHLRTFENRMRDYPIRIAALSRFQSSREQDKTIAALKEGGVDIVVGTHRLLSKDVHFKTLGLLIVDEEQRFGVTHKERIKQIRSHVDVLTLTATPIPRTLQMAVSGLRDLSLITTPPVDRRAVRTVVTRFDDQVLKEAVGRELERGGQLFYVYNRVDGLYEKAQYLQTLIPNARIAVGHGQMVKGARAPRAEGDAHVSGALERVMVDFVEGRYDILVATAIVESGLDIPRANTMIIDRADLFGLAQLYQLRGRVGRSKERAYCYLVVPPTNAMSDESRARIEALERHTELGSGFKIASLDLEIRGAGDLLGAEQSGTVASVGFDLFCQMLEEAVQELRGEPAIHEVDPELSFDVEALLPEEYVSDVGVRLSLYKRLASAIDEGGVTEIAEEMEERFGPPPEEARQLVQLMTLKTELRRLRVLGCEANSKIVTLHLREDTPLDPEAIMVLVRSPKSGYKLTPDMRLSCRFEGDRTGLFNAEAMLATLASCIKETR